MDFLQLPGEELAKLSDEELGEWLITAWICDHAVKEGFAPGVQSPEQAKQFIELAKHLVDATATVDSESVAYAPLESAFRKACKGGLAAAGRMFRAFQHARADARVKAKFAARDVARQNGTRKARRPSVDAWIDAKLERQPDAKSPALWANAPEWITEQLGKDRFSKRVTAARKRRKGRK